MKKLFMMLFAASSGIVTAQNQISTPVGQTLKVATDTLVVNSLINVKGGSVYLKGQRFLTTFTVRNTYGGNSGNVLETNTAQNNTFFGAEVGQVVTTGGSNTFYGVRSGRYSTTGTNNTFIGLRSGESNTIGGFNTFLGQSSGQQNTIGSYNVMLGNESGSLTTTGASNVYIGHAASYMNVGGSYNVAIGSGAGPSNSTSSNGSRNVFIGLEAGSNEAGSDKLYIANSGTATPIILGDFSTGKLGFSTANYPTSITASPIGGGSPVTVSTTNYKLFVKGGILTEALTVAGGWADYVFEKGYRLKPLSEVENFIAQNGHLPNVPSARTIELGGINVGDIARIQQEKIEELTLYVIELEKNAKSQEASIKELRSLMTELMKRPK